MKEIKKYKDYLAGVLVISGVIYYFIPSVARIGLFNPSFNTATNGEIGIMSMVVIATGIIIYFLPRDKN